jgi:hypothetical protein
MIVRFVRPIVPLALIGLLAAPLQGCIGSFALTNKVFSWNRGLGDIVAQEAVFLGFTIVQVYTFTTLADAIVLNLIEFVTGTNPVHSKGDPDHQAAELEPGATLELTREGRAIRVVLDEDGRRTERLFRPHGRAWEVLDGRGVLVAASEATDRGLVLRDGSGNVLRTVTPAEVVAAASAWAVDGGEGLVRAIPQTRVAGW